MSTAEQWNSFENPFKLFSDLRERVRDLPYTEKVLLTASEALAIADCMEMVEKILSKIERTLDET